jgi:hypothetical protein
VQQEGVWTAGSRVGGDSIMGSILQQRSGKFLGEFAIPTARPSCLQRRVKLTGQLRLYHRRPLTRYTSRHAKVSNHRHPVHLRGVHLHSKYQQTRQSQ